MMISPAVVTKVLWDRHGVMVAFRDGVYFPSTGQRFVRVLASRAHASGGASISLPQEGELGLVVEVDENLSVWLGSIHWQDANQVEAEPFLDSFRHESAVHRHLHRNGDMQLDHPSGLCLRVVEQGGDGEGGPLDQPHGSNVPPVTVTPAPWVALDHPTAGSLRLHPDGTLEVAHSQAGTLTMAPDGTLTVAHPSGGSVEVDPDGHLALHGFASQTFQDGANRFCMEDFWTWAKNHIHSGGTISGKTAIPDEAPPDSGLSPSTFLGPNG